jgi:hypothetical protein
VGVSGPMAVGKSPLKADADSQRMGRSEADLQRREKLLRRGPRGDSGSLWVPGQRLSFWRSSETSTRRTTRSAYGDCCASRGERTGRHSVLGATEQGQCSCSVRDAHPSVQRRQIQWSG